MTASGDPVATSNGRPYCDNLDHFKETRSVQCAIMSNKAWGPAGIREGWNLRTVPISSISAVQLCGRCRR